MPWVVHKSTRLPGKVSYTGISWTNLPRYIKYKEQYETEKEALVVAKALSGENPVGFIASEVEGD